MTLTKEERQLRAQWLLLGLLIFSVLCLMVTEWWIE